MTYKILGNVHWKEMARTFNCGLGMILVVKKQNVDRVLELLSQVDSTSDSTHNEFQSLSPCVVGHLEKMQSEEDDRVHIVDAVSAWGGRASTPIALKRDIMKKRSSSLGMVKKESIHGLKSSPVSTDDESNSTKHSVALLVETGVDFGGVLDALCHPTSALSKKYDGSLGLVVYLSDTEDDTENGLNSSKQDLRLIQNILQKNKNETNVMVISLHETDIVQKVDDALVHFDVDFVCWKTKNFSVGRSLLKTMLTAKYKGRLLSSASSLNLPITSLEPSSKENDDSNAALALTLNCRFHGTTVVLVLPYSEQHFYPVVWQELVVVESIGETSESLARRVSGVHCEGKAYVEALGQLMSGEVFYNPKEGVLRKRH